MDPLVFLLIGLVVGVVLGVVIGALLARSRAAGISVSPAVADPAILEARHGQLLAELREQEAAARAEVSSQLAAADASLAGLREQLTVAQQQYRDLLERERLEAQKRADAERDESKVLQALAPVKETLSNMQQKVTELETQRSQQHGELSQQLKTATESEERLRATAESLASALRNNATRGVWARRSCAPWSSPLGW
ncbi:MAG: DNA recombination protein RmuC [Actinomycetota bacterium]|nr:DNA recombination protein RmuC [Actinomycetota bacterium]